MPQDLERFRHRFAEHLQSARAIGMVVAAIDHWPSCRSTGCLHALERDRSLDPVEPHNCLNLPRNRREDRAAIVEMMIVPRCQNDWSGTGQVVQTFDL